MLTNPSCTLNLEPPFEIPFINLSSILSCFFSFCLVITNYGFQHIREYNSVKEKNKIKKRFRTSVKVSIRKYSACHSHWVNWVRSVSVSLQRERSKERTKQFRSVQGGVLSVFRVKHDAEHHSTEKEKNYQRKSFTHSALEKVYTQDHSLISLKLLHNSHL